MATLASCSRTTDRAVNRFYHRSTAKFNALYNGRVALADGKDQLRQAHRESYDIPLSLFDHGFAKEATPEAKKLERAVEKATKAIKEHSMMIRGKQKNAAVFEAYLLMGEAQTLLKLDVAAQQALTTIIRNCEDDMLKQRAELMRIELMLRMNNPAAAISALDELERKRMDKRFELMALMYRAEAMSRSGELEDAADLFARASRWKRGLSPEARARVAFISGQLYELIDEREQARLAYKRCVDAQPRTYDMLLEAQLRMSVNGSASGMSVLRLYKELERLLEEPKNKDYRDRIYTTLAQLAEGQEDEGRAMHYWDRAIANGQSTRPVLHAQAYAARGLKRFEIKQYRGAQNDLDSAYILVPAKHPLRESLGNKRKGLNDLIVVLEDIDRADSLLVLNSKSEAELKAYFEDYIKDLRRKIEEEERQREIAALNQSLDAEAELRAAASGPSMSSAGGQWLFYNPSSRARSIAEFQATWGQRPNVDSWRLNSASANWALEGMSEGDSANPNVLEIGEDPAFDVDSYLAQVPRGEAARADLIQEKCVAQTKAAAIFRDQIGDLDAALEMMISASECASEAPQAWYARYHLHDKRGEESLAAEAKHKVLTSYPLSLYAQMLRGEAVQEAVESQFAASEDFQKLIALCQRAAWASALDLTTSGEFSAEEMPRVAFWRARAIGATQGLEPYKAALQSIVDGYPNTPQAALALTYMTSLTGEWAPDQEQGTGIVYTESSAAPHQLMIVFSSDGNPNDVRNALASFHQRYFAGSALGMRILPFDDRTQIVMIDGLQNAADAINYRTKVMRATQVTQFLSPYGAKYWPITVQNFTQFYSQKDLQGYSQFVERVYPSK